MAALSFKTAILGDGGPIDATRLDASMLPGPSGAVDVLSLLAFDGDNGDAPVMIAATSIGGGGGGGGFTTQIVDTSAEIDIGSLADGVHYRLRVAAPLQLMANAPVGTRAAVTPASTGTTSVTVEGGAVYRLPPTDDPDNAGRAVAFDANDYTEFECIANVGGAAAEWDVWGVPAGTETTLVGTLNLNGQTVIPGAPIPIAIARSYLASDSGKTFVLTTGAGTQTIPAGLLPGWTVEIWNNTANPLTIEGPGAGAGPSLPSGQVAIVKYLTSATIKVALGETVSI